MNSETPPTKDESIGTLLKNERERKGLSCEQAAETIRLRLHFIEALEKEEWNALPAPVFIKGFIRSYAQFLGLNQDKAVALYEKTTDHPEEPPRPLIEPKPTGKLRIFLPVVILAILVIALFLWFRPTSSDMDKVSTDSTAQEENLSQEQDLPEEEPVPKELYTDRQDSDTEAAEAEEPSESPSTEDETGQEETEIPSVNQAADNTFTETAAPDPIPEILPELFQAEEQVPIIPEEVMQDPPAINDEDSDLLTLDGIINIRSYIKIYVDDQPAKEYMFRPGSRPQWKAKEGFDILVGNAAGVAFEFNGKATGDLGPMGKVIRVRFPEDFESSLYED